ncbi:protein POLR1D-like [Lytechinus pictus]|uniref:protein POLR1D-like n=1 Tax=Lytechinus pictus TaxID=7653 RepID=UPI0030B9C0C9
MEDSELDRLAAQELLQEAGRGKERASTMGAYGWKKRQTSTNKVFLKNTLRGVISGNKHRSSSRVEKQHKDSLKRTELVVECKEDNKMQIHHKGLYCERPEEASQDKNRMTPGHFSRKDDPHSWKAHSERTARTGVKEKNPRCQRRVSNLNSPCSRAKEKD